jgi:hypothetical protein
VNGVAPKLHPENLRELRDVIDEISRGSADRSIDSAHEGIIVTVGREQKGPKSCGATGSDAAGPSRRIRESHSPRARRKYSTCPGDR